MEQVRLAAAIKKIAWGYLLLHINFNLGSINILPNWLGYVLMLGALPILGAEIPEALLLRPLGILLAVWEGIAWGLPIFSISWDSAIFTTIATAVGLYFHFQLLTNLSQLAAQHNCPQDGALLRLRTVRTILLTVFILPIPWEKYAALSIPLVVVNLAVGLWICQVLFSLRRSLEGPTTLPLPSP
jgi:hypothetical protein